jgi:hypothetical protein
MCVVMVNLMIKLRYGTWGMRVRVSVSYVISALPIFEL